MYYIMKSFRSLKTLLPGELEELYKTYTLKEIEDIFNCDISVLYRLLDLYKIPRRFPRKYTNRRPKSVIEHSKKAINKVQNKKQLERGIKLLNHNCSEII